MKTKLDKKILLIIGIVVIIVAVVMLGRTYMQQVSEQRQLKANVAAQEALLRQLTTQEQDQRNRLAAAQSLFEESRTKFPEAVESIEFGEDLFKIARDCSVELVSLSPSMPGGRTAGSVTYSVSAFALVVQGSVDNVLKFINALRTGEGFRQAWVAEVHSVNIDFGDTPVATISLDIYGYKG